MRSAYLTLLLDTPAEAEQVYALLSEAGEIFMKMEETFFAGRPDTHWTRPPLPTSSGSAIG